eukprot:scaffold283991_cov31-Tisochrysis_lutea.AAC.2
MSLPSRQCTTAISRHKPCCHGHRGLSVARPRRPGRQGRHIAPAHARHMRRAQTADRPAAEEMVFLAIEDLLSRPNMQCRRAHRSCKCR